MELTGGGYSDSLHGGRIVGGGVSVHASKLEGLRGGRAKTDDSHVGKKAVGVASALNQLSPPAGDDVGGLFKTRGRKPTEHSAPAKQHGTSGERDLFSHHLGASESALKAREQTVAEHDLFGSLSRKAAVPHASAAHQPTSLHGGGTEEALLQLRLHDGKTQYIRCESAVRATPCASAGTPTPAPRGSARAQRSHSPAARRVRVLRLRPATSTHAAKPRERAPDAQLSLIHI